MSFHYQRLTNKLSKTKLPTSIHESHYSFKAKRSLKDEVYMPYVKHEDTQSVAMQTPAPVTWSNWRKQQNFPYYEYPHKSAFWLSIIITFLTLDMFYFKALNSRNQKILDAYTNTTMGVVDMQYMLDTNPMNPK